MNDPLAVWCGGAHVADLHDAGAGLAMLQHTPETVAQRNGERILSVRLPVRADPYRAVDARPFLESVAPEGQIRVALAERARVSAQDTLGLLRAFGRDCAGAVSFLPSGEPPVQAGSRVEWMDAADLERRVRSLPVDPFAADEQRGVRVSLGGVQGKLVVVVDGERLGLPVGAQPSTHILKPEQFVEAGPRYPGIVQAELFALRLAAALAERGAAGFVVPSARAVRISERRIGLLVERYDRDGHGTGIVRIHQEDACSALGFTPEQKYQSGSEGPSLSAIADLLSEHVSAPIEDRAALLQMVAVHSQLGNADLHAKNISLLFGADGLRLAPVYDPVPTFAWQGTSREVGMRVGGDYHLDDVTGASVVAEGESWGIGSRRCRELVGSVLSESARVVPSLLEVAKDEGWHHPVLDDVAARVVAFPATLDGGRAPT